MYLDKMSDNKFNSHQAYPIIRVKRQFECFIRIPYDHHRISRLRHFDIAELFARKLHKKMSEYKFDRDSYKKDLRKIYEDITEAKADFQNQYDKETDHSRKKEQQAEWLKKIDKMLSELKEYAAY